MEHIAQLRGRQAAGEFERAGERGVGVAQEGEANFGGTRTTWRDGKWLRQIRECRRGAAERA